MTWVNGVKGVYTRVSFKIVDIHADCQHTTRQNIHQPFIY